MEANLLKGLVDTKRLAIFLALLKNPDKLFTLSELAKKSRVPVATISRIIGSFTQNNLTERIMIGKIKVYKLAQNKKISRLKKMFKE